MPGRSHRDRSVGEQGAQDTKRQEFCAEGLLRGFSATEPFSGSSSWLHSRVSGTSRLKSLCAALFDALSLAVRQLDIAICDGNDALWLCGCVRFPNSGCWVVVDLRGNPHGWI